MVYQMIFNDRFQNKLQKLLTYIEGKFGLLVAQKFAEELNTKLIILHQQSSIGKPSSFVANNRSIIAGNHNRLYSRIEGTKMIIFNMYDMRINPKKYKSK